MSNHRTETPQGKSNRSLSRMVTVVLLALIILAVPILSAVLQAPIISPVYGCTAKIESNKPGTIGGTAVVINLKDTNGYTYVTGATTVSNISPQVGSQLTVTFSGAPTVKCWLEPVV